MADPRNIAHDKKVQDEKKHHHEPIAPEGAAVAPQPGKKTPIAKDEMPEVVANTHEKSQHHKDKTSHVEEAEAAAHAGDEAS